MRATRLSDCVFKPASVALVGASGDPNKTTARPFQFLQKHGFQGRIHVVNPRQKEVFGHPTVPSIEDLPETPDHAYILLNTDGAMEAARYCAERGVPVVSILASGFSESGAEGLAREQELRALVRETGTRIIGPNCLGVVNTHNGMSLTANAAFFEPRLDPGRFMLVSQSGSMLGSLLSRAQDRGLGFSRIVSVGNEVDMDIGTLSMGSVDDPEVEGFLLFLETIRHAESLTQFAAAAHAAGKPVLAYKLGRSSEGQELAVSHTGAMLSDDNVADTFLRDNGVARVTHLESLFESAPLFAGWSKAPRRRGTVGVVTTTGGGAAMVVDQLGVEGISVVGPTEGTLSKLAEAGLRSVQAESSTLPWRVRTTTP
ncbi:CoA-binding protein [Fodinicurvata halophila]|uniref:CoA-binding protein n=1 Tax=Fodinicurvata halophila TaxID=1419723 RepID=UPI00362FBE69